MKLYYSPTSPFVRKINAFAIETGLDNQIEWIRTNPWQAEDILTAENPLSQVPTLITDDGMVLYDSSVICEYLDSLNSGPKLFPESGPARWPALRQQSLADGIIDAAVACRYEVVMRPEDKQWPPWIEGQMRKVRGGLDALENEHRDLTGALSIGQIAVACALGWLEIRLNENWRTQRPALSDWFDGFSLRPSMQATVPPG